MNCFAVNVLLLFCVVIVFLLLLLYFVLYGLHWLFVGVFLFGFVCLSLRSEVGCWICLNRLVDGFRSYVFLFSLFCFFVLNWGSVFLFWFFLCVCSLLFCG